MRYYNSDKPDEEIALLVQAGDVDLFGVLVERYEKKMMRYARKFLSNQEDIEDAIQGVFLKAYENIQSFDTKRKFSTWLYSIAHNKLVNVLKKNKRRSLLFFSDLDTFLPQRFAHNNVHEDILDKEVRRMLDKCLEKLDYKYKEPLVLYYFEDMDYKQISDIMRIPVSTVGVRLKRGRKAMKSILKDSNYNL